MRRTERDGKTASPDMQQCTGWTKYCVRTYNIDKVTYKVTYNLDEVTYNIDKVTYNIDKVTYNIGKVIASI